MKICIICILVFAFIMLSPIYANAVCYEFDFSKEENANAENKLEDLINSLPDNIRSKLVAVDENNYQTIANQYSFSFFVNHFKETIAEVLPDFLNITTLSLSIAILIGLIDRIKESFDMTPLRQPLNFCTGIATTLSIYTMHMPIISLTGSFLKLLSDTMKMIVPIMEIIYISGGNITASTVCSASINVMIAFTENLFSTYISPWISILFLISSLALVSENEGIIFINKLLRTALTGFIILTMTLMSFALTIQSSAAASADKFGTKVIRYALGSYIPVVGGAISETFDILKNSVTTIKNMSGLTGIIIIILICSIPMLNLILAKISMYVSANLAGMLGANDIKNLFSEYSETYNLLIAVVVSSIAMYIMALSLFCKIEVAMW